MREWEGRDEGEGGREERERMGGEEGGERGRGRRLREERRMGDEEDGLRMSIGKG